MSESLAERVSFEDACKIQSSIMTRENFLTKGVRATSEEARDALAAVGWTSAGLCDEARRRSLEKIEIQKRTAPGQQALDALEPKK